MDVTNLQVNGRACRWEPAVLARWARRLAAGVLVCLGIAGPLRAQESALGANVQGLLDYARVQSPELAAMRLDADAAAQRLGSAGALADPVLRVERFNINNYGNEAGSTEYRLMQPLPGWGKRELRRDVAAADAEQASARAGATWAELTARIKIAYAEYYRTVGNERLTREVLDLMSRLEQVAQARYAGGLVAQQDAIRAQLEQTAMRSELISLDNEKRQLQARLNALLARDRTAPLADPQVLRPLPGLATSDAASLAERARARNPQLLAEQARVTSAQKSRDLTWSNRYPDWLIGLQTVQSGSRLTEFGVMIELNIPLQQDARRAQEREAESMVGAARSRAEAVANQLLGELAGNLAAFDGARRTEVLVETQLLPQSDLSLRSALAAYETGKVDFATLLDAQRQIRKAQMDRLKAQVEAHVRLAEIERIVGEDL
ncbi:MAG: TolC family protein [Burkholderiales bacterium]|nr:TolC family protein [Burkholderiales bacterium]